MPREEPARTQTEERPPSGCPTLEPERARELIRIGDIAGARLILERGSARNHGATLFALAQTYDPLELERWRVVGPKADANRAKHLYERANLGGSNPIFPRIAAVP